MEPDESRLSARERLAKDAQKEATLLRNILHFSLWTPAALVPIGVKISPFSGDLVPLETAFQTFGKR